MENGEIRKFIHDMRNSLNTANINVMHLRLGGSDAALILERLEAALGEATKLLLALEAGSQTK